MTRKIVLSGVFLLIVAVLFWVFNPGHGADVETVSPIHIKAVQAVYATGTVEASRMIPVSARIGARLMSLDADEGAKVVAGQTLAQLEDKDVQEDLKQFEAQAELARQSFARAEKLWKVKAISKTGFEQAQAELTAAQAHADRTKAELEYLQLLAPEDGTVIRRDGEIGELIPTGTKVFWISGGDSLRIETEVDEEDIGLIKLDQDVVIRADAFPDQTFNGKVQAITPKGDPVARSYRVRVSLPDNAPLLIGMTAETNIITQVKDDAMMVPASAVKGDAVYVMKGKKPVLTKIRKGIVAEKNIEILDGIFKDDVVALRYNDIAPDEVKQDKAVCNMGTGC